MANQEQVDRLRQGVYAWNQWRKEKPDVGIDLSNFICRDFTLSGIDFSNANLSRANFNHSYLYRGSNDSAVFFRSDGPGYTDLSHANLRGANLSGANLLGADLSDADLNSANLCNADLSSTNLNRANLRGADLLGTKLNFANLAGANLCNADLRDAELVGADLSRSNLMQARLMGAKLHGVDFRGAELIGADLNSADLSSVNFRGVNLSEVNLFSTNLNRAYLRGANLRGANLRESQALGTCFKAVTLTGACVQDWNINSRTNLQEVICEYIFTRSDYKQEQFTDRRPHDPNQIFAPGEFTKRYQVVLESVELFFNDGIDWKAFLASLKDAKAQYGDELNIQGIEKKVGGSFMVRLELPSDVDKGLVERRVKELYETNLQILEAKYHSQLQAKDHEIEIYKQKSADIFELAKLAASRPITVEAKAVAENRSSSENYNTTVHGNVGNLANKMQDQASQQANQYIGANLNEIAALIQSLRSTAETFPREQRTEAIEHLEDLETDLKQPLEKRKQSRMKTALVALIGIATAVSGVVAGANEFATQVQELSDKLGIPIPIEQVEPQPPQKNAIDVKAIGSD